MAISPIAIERFLERYEPPLGVKRRDPAELHYWIEDATGIPFKPKTAPYDHQLEGAALALLRKRCLLFFGMRLGKTKITLDWASHLRAAGIWKSKGLIISPSPIVLEVWRTEAQTHSNLKLTVVRNDVEKFGDALLSDCDLIALSWSTLQALFTYKIKFNKNGKSRTQQVPDIDLLRLVGKEFTLFAIDEIQDVKDENTLRFEMARAILHNCDYRLGLTGTPFGRNPFDLWTQAFLIDDGYTLGGKSWFFREAFGKSIKSEYTRSGRISIFDENKMRILTRKMEGISLSYKLEECRKLPDVLRSRVMLEMGFKQEEQYANTLDKIIRNREDMSNTQRENSFMRMRQISSGFLPFEDDDGNRHILRLENPKLDWLEDFLDHADGARVVIFHEFTFSGERITMLLDRKRISYRWLHGGAKDKPKAVADFASGNAQVLVANSKSGGVGIDLQAANYQLFFESPVAPIIRQQAEARALGPKRDGRALFMDDLICSPVEKKIVGFVQEGKDLLDAIIHGDKRALEALRVRKRI